MNVSQISQQQTSVIDFISSTGQQKVLTSLAGTETLRAIRAGALTSLSFYQCIVCEDVHSKPLQTRCCETVLCASCYNQLTIPKVCPNDRKPFTNTPSGDLKPMGRIANNQIERLLEQFTDIQATGTDTSKSEAQQAALAALEDQPASGTAIPEPSRPVSSRVDLSSAMEIGTIIPIFGRGAPQASLIPSAGTRSLSNNINTPDPFDSISETLHQIYQISTSLLEPRPPYRIREYPLDQIMGLDIFTRHGEIVLTEQLPQLQNTVSVTASTDPEILGNGYLKIAPRGFFSDVTVKLPQAFAQPLKIVNFMGHVTTDNGYRIKHGGSILANMGNIRIAVDSARVKVETMGPNSEVTVANHNEALGRRTELSVRSLSGIIYVTD
ncbi:hypothetical protein [Endozoicomonas sp. YOMI1]|uniref:hypothetical protein n=1 Tax=Endozoicomonas sp. YOMI1 TaxID=2828739 RepID=UPI0021476476|nr:hypothetical protein [Endozoicomonas sp. YOMI1]